MNIRHLNTLGEDVLGVRTLFQGGVEGTFGNGQERSSHCEEARDQTTQYEIKERKEKDRAMGGIVRREKRKGGSPEVPGYFTSSSTENKPLPITMRCLGILIHGVILQVHISGDIVLFKVKELTAIIVHSIHIYLLQV